MVVEFLLIAKKEFEDIKSSAGGMLVRSYSATNNIPSYAAMLEKTINTAWHALSFWWFNLADGRGPINSIRNFNSTY